MGTARRGQSDTLRFSVVVPTYGRPGLLAEALASVARQTVEDFECIVVDDATPGGLDVELPDERFRLVRHGENRGIAAARNTGLREAVGSGIIFLDDDDLFTPERLAIAADGLAQAPVALCSGATLGSSERNRPRLHGDVYDVILNTTTPHLGMTAVRRDSCLEFDESYRASQDLEWWIRMAQRYPVVSDERIGWVWRRHDGVRTTNGPEERLAASLRLMQDHAEYFRTHRRAAAFRWFRIATMARELGDSTLSRKAVGELIRLDRRPRSLWRAGRLTLSARSTASPASTMAS